MFGEKVDALDLIIQTLREHEKELDEKIRTLDDLVDNFCEVLIELKKRGGLSSVKEVRIIPMSYVDKTEKRINTLLAEGWKILHIGEDRREGETFLVYTLGRFKDEDIP